MKKIKFTHVEEGLKIRKCLKKSNFQNYGTVVVDSLKRPSRRVEKENIKPLSVASPGTWFRPFTGLLLPGGTPQ